MLLIIYRTIQTDFGMWLQDIARLSPCCALWRMYADKSV